MSNTKNYIGKGREKNYGSIRVNIKMSEAEKFVTESNGEKYLTFMVSKMKAEDKFKNTHSVFCLTPTAEPEVQE